MLLRATYCQNVKLTYSTSAGTILQALWMTYLGSRLAGRKQTSYGLVPVCSIGDASQ